MDCNIVKEDKQYESFECEACSEEFTRLKPIRKVPKFCSQKCWDKLRVRKKIHSGICKQCGCGYKTASRTSSYCSAVCSSIFRENDATSNTCKKCNTSFVGKRSQEYCSDECKTEIRDCDFCGEEFEIGHYKTDKYCNIQCANKSRTINEHECERCGNTFLGRKDRANRYCDRKCFFEQVGFQESEHKQLNRLTDFSSYSRAGGFGVERERIDILFVFERDEWACGICGEEVNARLPFPDKMSASLDHTMPLSKGGTHTYDNVKLAHLGCNMSKGVESE